ncbi:hypothetical protein BGZ70_006377 [Mortierella alpina]|uniref:Uncharacterized protein n=1 Tax=Mortierella alpina TaxID=64518 RepID=A0A9P6J814_MORAP|nr:hypothetical protein BGZ70_006377 [Mortierella alpina]
MFDRSPSPPIVKIPGHFGDIMSKRDTTLVLPDGFSGSERILLTANGNLQRLISAYFNKTVSVTILENTQVPLTSDEDPAVMARFQREVNLLCNNKIVCNAKSRVLIQDPKIYDLVVKNGVGIGQIFRYLDRLPSFELHGLGRTDKTFWREYSLTIPGVDCRLLEVLPSALFDENWLEKEQEGDISWEVEQKEEDRLTWVRQNTK